MIHKQKISLVSKKKNGVHQIIFPSCVRKVDRWCCGAGGDCIYHIGPFKRKHRIYYTTRRLLFFIPVDSRRAVLCVRSCACVGQCLLLFSPFSFTHTAAAEHTRDELPVIVSPACLTILILFLQRYSNSGAVD